MSWIAIAKRYSLRTFLMIFGGLSFFISCYAQDGIHKTSSYEIHPAPDLWYNSVDGARIGIRLKGQVPGTFSDGPHRLNFGFWVGTKRPKLPVSYYLTFLEPIRTWSDFGAEASIQLISSVRTGFTDQGLVFRKRWQSGFDDNQYEKLKIYLHTEKLFDKHYRLFPEVWNQNWLTMLHVNYQKDDTNRLGKYVAKVSLTTGIPTKNHVFDQFQGEYHQEITIGNGFRFRGRIFLGLSTSDTPNQMLYMAGLSSPEDWLKNGITRARGTVPPLWLKEGWIQYAGGPNLRGYANAGFQSLFNKKAALYKNFGAANLEMIYPNPLTNAISKIEFIGDLLKFKSYVFFDTGSSLDFSGNSFFNKKLSDSGAGFTVSFSFPDNEGGMKKITIRYDIPLWLSSPVNQPKWKYRDVLALSAIISI